MFSYNIDQVKFWVTFNEPQVFVYLGYGIGYHAPGIQDPLGQCINAAHTVIKAHTKVYHMYKQEFASQNGRLSTTKTSMAPAMSVRMWSCCLLWISFQNCIIDNDSLVINMLSDFSLHFAWLLT